MSDGGETAAEPPQMDEQPAVDVAGPGISDLENTAHDALSMGCGDLMNEDKEINHMELHGNGSGAVNVDVEAVYMCERSPAAAATGGAGGDAVSSDDGEPKVEEAVCDSVGSEETVMAGSAQCSTSTSAGENAQCCDGYETPEPALAQCKVDELSSAEQQENDISVNSAEDECVSVDDSCSELHGLQEDASESVTNELNTVSNGCNSNSLVETDPHTSELSDEDLHCSQDITDSPVVNGTTSQLEPEPLENAASNKNGDTVTSISVMDAPEDSQPPASDPSDIPESMCTHSGSEDKACNSAEVQSHDNQDNSANDTKQDIRSDSSSNPTLDCGNSIEESLTNSDIQGSNLDNNMVHNDSTTKETSREPSPEPCRQMELLETEISCDKKSNSEMGQNDNNISDETVNQSTHETRSSAGDIPEVSSDELDKVLSEPASDNSDKSGQSQGKSMTSLACDNTVTDTEHSVLVATEPENSVSLTTDIDGDNNLGVSQDSITCQSESQNPAKSPEDSSDLTSSETECDGTSDSNMPIIEVNMDSKFIEDSTLAADLTLESGHLSTSVESLGSAPVLASSKDSDLSGSTSSIGSLSTLSPCKSSTNSDDAHLLSELDAELEQAADPKREVVNVSDGETPNGLKNNVSLSCIPEYRELKGQQDMLQKTLLLQQGEIQRLTEKLKSKSSELETTTSERNKLKAQVETFQNNSQEDAYILQIKELENMVVDHKAEAKQFEEKLTNHDAAAKKAITALQEQLKAKVEQLTKSSDECRREKDTMVVKYAQAESRNLELQGHMTKMQMQMKEWIKEKEMMIARFRSFKADKQKAVDAYEARTSELNAMRKELEKQKETAHSASVSTKWAQNKLKAEVENHKESKWRLEETQRKLKQAKEETEMIRRDCQAMIKTYQESEEIKSSELDAKLKVTREELVQHQQEKTDQQEVHHVVKRELDTLKNKHKEIIEELKTWKDKVKCLDTERQHQEDTLTKYKATLQTQKNDNQELKQRLDDLEDVEIELKDQKDKIDTLEEQVKDLSQTKEDLTRDMEGHNVREIDHLEYTQKMSETNAHLLSENTSLSAKVKGLSAEVERLSEICEKLKENNAKLSKEFAEVTRLRSEETNTLTTQLNDKLRISEDLSVKLEDYKDEVKTLKRKHAANTKDLTRQLHQAKKRLEVLESKDATSMGSRTSSNNSLEAINGQSQQNHRGNQENAPQEDCPPIVEVVEVDKQMLVEKIVRLQRSHARKNEKLEFQEDHINQLLVEVKKKNKIIQSYMMREEAGTLTPDTMDINKAQMARKMGIMASMYNHHPKDGEMTLDLSLEINHKLQGVLEDTLLKNITLKENIDTLGREIAQLSQENRKLQLKMQEEAEKQSLEKPLQQ